MEIYGVENHVTGSVFVTFALEPAIKKEATMNTLLSLFIAADKVNRIYLTCLCLITNRRSTVSTLSSAVLQPLSSTVFSSSPIPSTL
jgi:hypothetical protein